MCLRRGDSSPTRGVQLGLGAGDSCIETCFCSFLSGFWCCVEMTERTRNDNGYLGRTVRAIMKRNRCSCRR